MVVFAFILLLPFQKAEAGILDTIKSIFTGKDDQVAAVSASMEQNSQNVPLLTSSINLDTSAAKGGAEIVTINNNSLVSESGPAGTAANISDTANTGRISKYTVRDGDTLSGIAKMFGVSVNTIVWANDVTAKTLKPGMSLVILPVSGTVHTVAKGDTIQSIAKKYKADSEEIIQFNGLPDNAKLAIGDEIIIPDGDGSSKISAPTTVASAIRASGGPVLIDYFLRPLAGGIKTQGIHGYNGVDIGTPVGSPVYASANGEVIISRSSGWNGGYGDYIVIAHPNGTQTLYAHLSLPYVSSGQSVSQGQIIGLSGNTGRSTGPHLHFEVRGARNPF